MRAPHPHYGERSPDLGSMPPPRSGSRENVCAPRPQAQAAQLQQRTPPQQGSHAGQAAAPYQHANRDIASDFGIAKRKRGVSLLRTFVIAIFCTMALGFVLLLARPAFLAGQAAGRPSGGRGQSAGRLELGAGVATAGARRGWGRGGDGGVLALRDAPLVSFPLRLGSKTFRFSHFQGETVRESVAQFLSEAEELLPGVRALFTTQQEHSVRELVRAKLRDAEEAAAGGDEEAAEVDDHARGGNSQPAPTAAAVAVPFAALQPRLRHADANHDGRLSEAEVTAFVAGFAASSRTTAVGIFAWLDSGAETRGRIDWEALKALLTKRCTSAGLQQTQTLACLRSREKVLAEIDADGDGALTLKELVSRDVQSVMSMLDTDKSGDADFAEIKAGDREGIAGTRYRLASMILSGSMTLSSSLVRLPHEDARYA